MTNITSRILPLTALLCLLFAKNYAEIICNILYRLVVLA